MEEIKHIKNIKVENFKCFNSFEVSDFAKYNFILGDNNVGKTSFLEMLLFDENLSQTIQNFQALLEFKKILFGYNPYQINPFIFFKNRYSDRKNIFVNVDYINKGGYSFDLEPVEIKNIDPSDREKLSRIFNFNTSDEEFLKIETGKETTYRKFEVADNYEGHENFVKYVYSTSNYSDDLVDFYLENFSESKKAKEVLIDNLKFLLPNIVDIQITLDQAFKQPLIGVWLDGKDSILPLAMFGDGSIRLFRIIMEIVKCKNSYLCIDEIDTGIHHSKYKAFSKTIMNISSLNNVQLFISTHNNEFLKAFKEILEEEDLVLFQKEFKLFTLKKLPDESIKAYNYNFDEFEFAIEQENELR